MWQGINFQHEIQKFPWTSESEWRKDKKRRGGSVMNWRFGSQSRLSPLRSGIICKWCRSSFIINYCNHVRQCYSLLPTCGMHCSRACTHRCQSVPCLFMLFMLPCLTVFFFTLYTWLHLPTQKSFLSKQDQFHSLLQTIHCTDVTQYEYITQNEQINVILQISLASKNRSSSLTQTMPYWGLK